MCGRLPGQFGGRELDEEVSGAADERLVREVLGDLGQQVVNHGHVALAVQHLLLPVQHNLSGTQTRDGREVRGRIEAETTAGCGEEYLEDFLRINGSAKDSPPQQSRWASTGGRPGRSHTTERRGGSLTGRGRTT